MGDEISWDDARQALLKVFPTAEVTWDSYRLGESAEKTGLPVRWERVESPLRLDGQSILSEILSRLPAPLSGDLVVITHDSFLGGKPHKFHAEDLRPFVAASPAHALDGGFLIIAPRSGIVVAYQSEDDFAPFCIINGLSD